MVIPLFYMVMNVLLRLRSLLLMLLMAMVLSTALATGPGERAVPAQQGGLQSSVPLKDHLEAAFTHQSHLLRLEQALRADDETPGARYRLLTEWSLGDILLLLCGLLAPAGVAYHRHSFRDRFSRYDRRQHAYAHLLYRFSHRRRHAPLVTA